MKSLINSSVKYDRPTVDILEMATESMLCASSEELDDIQKEDFDFGWIN